MSVVPQTQTGVVDILGRQVGNGDLHTRHRCLIIAELGLNHCGRVDLAKQMIDAAAEAGADVVKLQKRVLSATYTRAANERPNDAAIGLAYYMPVLRQCELPDDAWPALKARAEAQGLGFLVTPWDEPSVDFLEHLGVGAYKIASADMTNIFLHRKIAATKKPMIVSTGMASEYEVFAVLPSLKEQAPGRLILMHAVSSYPAAFRDCQLHAMFRLKINFQVPVGWSGHERGVAVSVAAAALGADVIERHFTLDRTLPGPDQAASLEPDGLRKLVERVRAFEEAYGDPLSTKVMNRGELQSREILGKRLVARKAIKSGQVLAWDDLAARSPGRGLAPQLAYRLVGLVATRDLAEDEPLKIDDARKAEISTRA